MPAPLHELPLTALELLAPARDAETGIAAIDHGADAVYIGGPRFGARAAACNTLDDIAKLADYAHQFSAKVFVALNTLLKETEVEPARKLAFDAAAAGADVLILQDMGLLEGPLPEIELHASTQCDTRTPEKAAFLEASGFSQIVLARELTLEEIAAVRAKLKSARIEFFVHGALCVSYSGQCFMSEAMTKRSANRGECSQLCRLPYDVFAQDGTLLKKRSHVLSLKDNNQLANLEALIDAGVSSFKIEGRLKDAAYVKNITALYRHALDDIIARRPELSRSSDGISRVAFTPDAGKTFNRDSTEYFIHGKNFADPYELAQLEGPKNAGKPCAKVIRVESGSQNRILAEEFGSTPIANGDGLTYKGTDDEIHGFSVNRTKAFGKPRMSWLYPAERVRSLEGLHKDATLSRNRDHLFLQMLQGKSAERRIPISLVFTHHEGALGLAATDGVHSGSASVAMELDAPKVPDRNIETLRMNLSKLGGTHYMLESPDRVCIPENLDVFVPASVANELRRKALESLTQARAAARMRPARAPANPSVPYPAESLLFNGNVANSAAKAFYEKRGVRVLQPAFEIQPVRDAHLMTCRHCVRASLKLCPKMAEAFPEILETTERRLLKPEPLLLVNSAGKRFLAKFHCRLKPCEMTITKL